ncbi:MAG: hypothetical protein OXH57_11490 [Ekhidna sp.]|nr:hypothetical protein [Ekhidna sp.]
MNTITVILKPNQSCSRQTAFFLAGLQNAPSARFLAARSDVVVGPLGGFSVFFVVKSLIVRSALPDK